MRKATPEVVAYRLGMIHSARGRGDTGGSGNWENGTRVTPGGAAESILETTVRVAMHQNLWLSKNSRLLEGERQWAANNMLEANSEVVVHGVCGKVTAEAGPAREEGPPGKDI